jgi:glycosyltransferase involved in cell wall biosynthesis
VPESAPAPLEVTIVANDIGPEGGMERQLTELIGGLLAAGDRVTVVSWTCTLPAHPNLRWIEVPGPSRPFSLAYPLFLLLASTLVSRHGRGLLHSTGAIVLNRTALCTVHFCHHGFAGVPGLSRVSRSSPTHRLNAWVVRRMCLLAESWCYRPGRAKLLVGVSGGLVRELGRSFPRMEKRAMTIPNGVDTERFSPAAEGTAEASEDGPLRAVFVGSEWERKGLRLAIAALAQAPEVELTVVGAGDESTFEALARTEGVGDRVTFTGPTTDTPSHYRRAQAFLLPTAYEAAPLVTYEAAASGLPLLVTKVNGVEDLLRDGHNGYFIDRDPTHIADRLNALVADPAKRRAMGTAARQDSLEYSWSRVVDRYREVYAELGGSART